VNTHDHHDHGDALARRAATALRSDVDRRVDVDAALARALTDDGARVLPLVVADASSGRSDRRAWLGAAAAVLLVGAGVTAFAFGRDDDTRVVPADATDPTTIDTAPPTPPSTPTTSAAPPDTSVPTPDTSPPPTLTTVVVPPASEIDALAGLVAPSPLDPVEVPAFLPTTPVAERSQVQLRQFSEPIETVTRLVQTWGSEAGQVLEVTTSLGGDPTLLFDSETSFGSEVSEVDVWPWDEAVVASANEEQVQLRDPSGTVRLYGFGFTSEELVTIATGMTLTPDGWALASTADAGLIELHAGWTRTTYATRILQWDTGTVRGEVLVTLGAPGAMLSALNETSAVRGDLQGAPALVTELGTGTAVSWSPAPDVVVVLGYTGSVEETLTLARSLAVVDDATWRAAGGDVTSEADGCDSYFFC
jgi:hypothetical protein